MKVIDVSLILTLIILVSAKESSVIEKPSAYDYHNRFGIPKAAEIKKWENENINKTNEQRIIGGWHADVSQFPYQAGLVIQINVVYQSVCGASLISNNRLVTAAHCWRDGTNIANSFTVVLGSNFIFYGGLRILTTDVVTHPDWNPATLVADIAVIRIRLVSFSNVVQPVNVPTGNELSWDFTGWTATASGFGMTANNAAIEPNQRLSAVTVPVLNPSNCRDFYGQWFQNSNICSSGAGGLGTCQGDSGGPLVTTVNNRRTLIGVASYGSWYGCEAGDPSVFARVTSFANWIRSI